MSSSSQLSAGRRSALLTNIHRWVRNRSFSRDVAVVLAVKLALLIVLKLAFFNHPQAANLSMPPAEVARALISVPVPDTR